MTRTDVNNKSRHWTLAIEANDVASEAPDVVRVEAAEVRLFSLLV